MTDSAPAGSRAFAAGVGLAAVAAGALVLVGWQLDSEVLKSVLPGFAPMKPNAAVGLLALGAALAVHANGAGLTDKALATVAMAIGAATLAEYLLGVDLGIDALLFEEAPGPLSMVPGRMSPFSAMCLLVLGAAIVLPGASRSRHFDPAWVLAPLGLLAAWVALVSYAYTAGGHANAPFFPRVAVHSAALFLLIALALLSLRPDQLVIAAVLGNTPGGLIARALLPAALFVPAVLGLLALELVAHGALYFDLATLLVSTVSILLFSSLVLWTAVSLARSEQARRQADTALRESEERFRTLITALAQIVWDCGPDGRVRGDLAAWRAFTGQSRAEVQGEGFLDAVHPDDREALRAGLRQAVRERQAFSAEHRLRRADGAWVWMALRAAPVLHGAEALSFIAIEIDISQRKRAEAVQRDFARMLERSNQDLEQFAAVASHDLQEPLRKVQMFGQLLREHCGVQMNDEGRSYLERMENAAARGQSLVRGLLSYSRVSTRAHEPGPVDLSLLVREALGDLEAAIRDAGAEVEVEALPVVHGDALQLRQVFQNLIGNAVKFRQPGVAPRVRISARQAAGGWEISVADNGIGFDEKYLDRIFKLFQRLHERGAYEGAGLGLAICKKVIERHGGQITATSAPGAGATFHFVLPAAARAREAAA